MDERIVNLENQLEMIASKIEVLEHHTVESESSHLVVRLKAKYTVAIEKLKELKEAGDESWEYYKTDLWIVWYELDNALRDVQQITIPEKKLSAEQLNLVEKNERSRHKQSDVLAFPPGGKRISTPADILNQKNWIALNASKIELINAMRSCRPVKPKIAIAIEKDEAIK